MNDFKHGNAIIRIHGSVDQKKLKISTETYMKKVERKRKNEKKEAKST